MTTNTSYFVFPDEITEYRRKTGAFFDTDCMGDLDPATKVATFYGETERKVPLAELDVQAIVKVTEGDGKAVAEIANEEFGYPLGNLQPLAVIWPEHGQETFAIAASFIGAWQIAWEATGS